MDFVSEGEGEPLDSLEDPVNKNVKFETTVFVCGLPKIDSAKKEKLLGVLGKVLDKYGANEKHMPFDEATGKSCGVVIVTYESIGSSDAAVATLNGFRLDSNHTFKAVKIDAFDEITHRPDTFQPNKTLSSFPRSDFRDWLADDACREQILLRYQNDTEIYWHDPMAGAPVLCYGGEREKRQKKIWCDWKVQWSPLGSYLATFHQQGVALWAGPEFTRKMRFPHNEVRRVQFSPNEDHIVTWNGAHPSQMDDNAVRIFRVLTGESMRTCRTPSMAPAGGEFPHYLWSHDGKYFAECNETSVLVRETDTFNLITDEDGKARQLKYDSLHTFQWSPKDNILAVWTLEKNQNPARLVLVEIPSRRELASRSRTQVEASIYWQSEGDYLCLLVTKLSKTGKKGNTNLEIFRLRARNIPVDIVELRDTVSGFFWETKGNRFGVMTKDEAGHRPKILFYALGNEKCENVQSFDLPASSFTDMFWAPNGQYFVCAAMGHGDLLFAGLMPDHKLELLHKDEHFMVTDVLWDPSSRYVITAVSQPMRDEAGGYRFQMEAGYAIWTFQGRNLYKQQKEKLWQVAWRPHPPSMLSDQKQREIRKNIKQFSKRYDALDDHAKEHARQAFRRDRDEKMGGFREILDRLAEYRQDRADENGWDAAWDAHGENQGWEMDETTIEEELDTSEELISG